MSARRTVSSYRILAFLALFPACRAEAPEPVNAGPSLSEPASAGSGTPEPVAAEPPPPTHYFGREIARTMHWRGAEWLLRETREKEENVALLMEALDVRPGMTVCDLGCGNGFHTLRLAAAVGPAGRVFAVDIQEPMLRMLGERVAEAGFNNVDPILGGVADPKLPDGSCDLILLADVYHEISHPEEMLANIRRALKPDGRVVLVEFRAEDPEVPIKRLHKMSKAQIVKELQPSGLELVREFDELPWQHVMFFGRAPAPSPPSPR
ncbi:MAG: class I SAM-dependent methyltransferase [Planctomycetota bacterium]|nr:class I SAM-dependent methyltransferase [Planctomycetota bacterium]